MKNKKAQKIIDEFWQEQITSRRTPTQDELCKEAIGELHAEDQEKTNFQMYKEISAVYDGEGELEHEVISKAFDLENRTPLDLKNLREFIIAVTLTSEESEFKEHEQRCDLMMILVQAIDSELCCRE